MTRWTAEPRTGRSRGPRAVVRAWAEVLTRPRRFFRSAVAPGDQAPGLTFAMAVVSIEETSRLLLVDGAIPEVTGSRALSGILALAVAVFLVAPAALHLVSGLQTVLLIPLVDDRGGVGETVQVLAYATAPCALAGPDVPELRVACAAYGVVLYAIGLGTIHGVGFRRSVVVGAVPAAIVFGYGFRGFVALEKLLSSWYVI